MKRRFSRFVWGGAALLLLMGPLSAAQVLPSPGGVLQGLGIDTRRDLDGQVPTDPEVAVFTEDRVGPTADLGPGGGGQRYDVEGMYSWRTETHVYIALSTGFRSRPGYIARKSRTAPSSPDSALAGVNFRDRQVLAGDILFDLAGDGTYDLGISMGAYTNANGRAGMNYGDLYTIDTTLGHDGVYLSGYPQAGAWIGAADEILQNLDYGAEAFKVKRLPTEDMQLTLNGRRARYLSLFAIDLSLFPQFAQAFSWHWTMECGNDFGDVEMPGESPPPPPPPVPEPGTIALLSVGAVALGARRFLRRR